MRIVWQEYGSALLEAAGAAAFIELLRGFLNPGGVFWVLIKRYGGAL